MDESPGTWHYGLIARWWAETNVAEPAELGWYRRAIERYGQPALDVGCGTGRLLLPLLAEGLDVDGADISADMLALGRRAASAAGLEPQLYEQAFHELELPRSYRTVYICDSFGIGGDRGHDRQALRRIHDLLEPGGGLVMSHDMPYGDEGEWQLWLPGRRAGLPEPWPATGNRRPAEGGDQLELIKRTAQLDPQAMTVTYEIRARLWRNDEFVREEERSLQTNMYFQPELVLMLEEVGFGDIRVEAAYTGEPATADDVHVAFIATKPA